MIVNIYAPNIGAPQYIRQTLTDIKGEIDRNTIIVGPPTPSPITSKCTSLPSPSLGTQPSAHPSLQEESRARVFVVNDGFMGYLCGYKTHPMSCSCVAVKGRLELGTPHF